MNWLDVIVLIVLIISAFVGFSKGLIKTLVPLIAIVIGVVLAGRFHTPLADWLSHWFKSNSQAEVVAFLIIILLTVIAAFILAMVLSGFLKMIFLGWADKLAGLVFGLILGALVCSAALALAAKFPFWNLQPSIHDSTLARFLLDQFPFVLGLLPKEFHSVRDFFN